MRRFLGVFALTLAIAACTGGLASAKTSHATAPVQQGNGTCGSNQPADLVMGSAKFKRSGNNVTLSVKLTKGAPNTAYYVDAVENRCSAVFGFEIMRFTTNKKGRGHGTGTFEMPGTATEVFANVYPTTHFELNETPAVSLP
jgi:hypothetical protein